MIHKEYPGSEAIKRLLIETGCRNPSPKYVADMLSRELVVTPFDGCYGRAGWVLALNGSPPRGVIVSLEANDTYWMPEAVFLLHMDRSRRMGSAQCRVVREFIKRVEAECEEERANAPEPTPPL